LTALVVPRGREKGKREGKGACCWSFNTLPYRRPTRSWKKKEEKKKRGKRGEASKAIGFLSVSSSNSVGKLKKKKQLFQPRAIFSPKKKKKKKEKSRGWTRW